MCRVDGCNNIPTKFSHLCEYHRNVDRVHGHPLQTAVTKGELRPYTKAINGYLSKKSGPHVQSVIDRDWKRAVHQAEVFVADAQRGIAQNVHQRRAMEIIISVSGEQSSREIAVTLMAMGYFYADHPRRWASDAGFQFQTARMLRKLAKGEVDYTWQPDGRMVRSSAKRCPKAVTVALWSLISATSFINYGVMIRQEIEKERDLKRKDQSADLMEILGPASFTAKGYAV